MAFCGLPKNPPHSTINTVSSKEKIHPTINNIVDPLPNPLFSLSDMPFTFRLNRPDRSPVNLVFIRLCAFDVFRALFSRFVRQFATYQSTSMPNHAMTTSHRWNVIGGDSKPISLTLTNEFGSHLPSMCNLLTNRMQACSGSLSQMTKVWAPHLT
jgi:hypothetical protein